MQIEREQTTPTSQPLAPGAIVEPIENDGDPEEIFLNAVAEIDTQPLVKSKAKRTGTLTIAEVLEVLFLASVLLFGLLGSAYLAITYPHTLVILYAKAQSASITATLDVPTRILAPVTLTRSATTTTTGTGHQDARPAVGTLTFYNGLLTSQTVPRGTVFVGGDGVQVSTDQSVSIPAANPPQEGEATVPATTIRAGNIGNIHSYDINTAFSSSLFVKNLQAFTGGRDARTYKAVASQELTFLTSKINETVTQAFTTAFSLRQGEAARPTNCKALTTADHATGAEARTLTVTMRTTCQGIAYNHQELNRQAIAAFTQTKPAAPYHLVGSVQTSLQSVTPLTVALSGKWAYTFTQDYEQHLAEQIAGDTPTKAKAVLLKTGVIADASIPNTLPPIGYIDFLVLVG